MKERGNWKETIIVIATVVTAIANVFIACAIWVGVQKIYVILEEREDIINASKMNADIATI